MSIINYGMRKHNIMRKQQDKEEDVLRANKVKMEF